MNIGVPQGGLLPLPFDQNRYLPVLLTRQGELHALRETPDATKDKITPLFVVHPIDVDPSTRLPKRTIDEHLETLAKALLKDWGQRPAFVDLRYIGPVLRMGDGSHPVAWFVDRCIQAGLPLGPSLSLSHVPAYRAAAVAAAHMAGTALVLRLGPQDWSELGTPLGDGRLLGLLAQTGRAASDVHLLLDVEAMGGIPNVVAAAIRPALRDLPHAADWASLTVAGTGMPAGTAEVGRNATAEIARTEWLLWRLLDQPQHRALSFGDYAIQHPDPISDFNPLFMDSSAQLRYTISTAWFVARGSGVKAQGNSQIHGLAQQVVSHREFSGQSFSWGDDWLLQCANHACGGGNQSVWRKVTTNHHLAFVVHQLATLLGP